MLNTVVSSGSPWIQACDGNQEPEEFGLGERAKLSKAQMVRPRTYRAVAAGGVPVDKMLDYVTICKSLKNRVETIQVSEHFDLKLHTPVSVEIRIGKMDKWQKELKKTMELPGYNGGKMPAKRRVVYSKGREQVVNSTLKESQELANSSTKEVQKASWQHSDESNKVMK